MGPILILCVCKLCECRWPNKFCRHWAIFGYALSAFKMCETLGNSLEVQWLGLGAFTARARIRSLVWEMRSRKLRGEAKKEKKKSVKLEREFDLPL